MEVWDAFYEEQMQGIEPYEHYDNGYEDAIDKVNDWLETQPAADVAEVKHGEWTYGEFDIPHCSECRESVMPNNVSPYCPNCGAMMDGGEE